MFRPDRLTSTSIICPRKDLDFALEALDHFGSFHIEETSNSSSLIEYDQYIRLVEIARTEVADLIKQLGIEKPDTWTSSVKRSMQGQA
jgi:hypothetical protein